MTEEEKAAERLSQWKRNAAMFDPDADVLPLREIRTLLAAYERRGEAIRLFIGAAYPTAPEVNQRGYNWSEVYLDQAREFALNQETHHD